ncbi:hypothetical protein SAMN05428945_3476 [Streptomyces sp. 2224.1]|nr:hypothetical protein BX261_1861 [Streptomyces sp. 2321.6]SDR52118.1 hypothetical protein SAMN05216511_5354 [Streptomyces sp. KS_16]SEC38562.1 hypothetical protein SAMN05428940_1863 [Streptomyces sp. 2133.1]SEC64860.1 hypothetical protein SAMN05428945_3476 [Streptomyces sp. 2224.1]SNC67076.1 hypothetical protein SAMN06272741_1858 [Streptomyces sp. 2114.4]
MYESSPSRCSPPRLLPWTRPDGGPCYLSTDNPDSPLSLLADQAEDDLIAAAEALLDETGPLPAVRGTDTPELCRTAAALHQALRDVLRIAVSRGDRLPEPCDHGETRLCEGRTCCRACRQQIYLQSGP